MRTKSIVLMVLVFSQSVICLDALSLIGDDGELVDDGATVCANASYYYQTDEANMYEADILNPNNLLLDTINAKNAQFELIFPTSSSDISVALYEYSDDGKEYVDSIDLKVKDCGYEQLADEYEAINPRFKYSVNENSVTIEKPSNEDYKLYYNYVEEEDAHKFNRIRFDEGTVKLPLTTRYIQFTEEYTNDKGKDIVRYYELDTNEQKPIIRKLSTLELQIIEPLDYIDKDVLIRVLIGLIIFIGLTIIQINLVKKYRRKKKYRAQILAEKKNRKK